MAIVYDIYMSENDISEIEKGKIVKRFVGAYVLNIKKIIIGCPKCGEEMKKDYYCKKCDIQWDDCDIV